MPDLFRNSNAYLHVSVAVPFKLPSGRDPVIVAGCGVALMQVATPGMVPGVFVILVLVVSDVLQVSTGRT